MVAALAWVGGALFYLVVLRPSLTAVPGEARSAFEQTVARYFQDVTQTSIVVFLVTGAILTFDRLTADVVGAPYLAVLGLKVILSLVMFWLAWEIGRRRRQATDSRPAGAGPAWLPAPIQAWLRPSRLILSLGLLVVLLGLLLRTLYEAGLRAGS